MDILSNIWKKKWYILGAEVLCIILYGLYLLVNYSGISSSFTGDELSVRKTTGEVTQSNYFDKSFGDESIIVSPNIQLDKGVYVFTVNYTATEYVKAGIAYVMPRDNKKIIFEVPLSSTKEKITYQFVADEACQVYSYARLTGDAGEDTYAIIDSVEVVQKNISVIREIAILAAFFFLLNAFLVFCLYYKRLSSNQEKIIAIGLLLLTFVISLPLYQELVVDCIDLPFHLMRIEGLYEGLMGGQFPVKLQPGWLNGYGYAVSVFYGDILLYFPAFLRVLGFTLSEVFKAYAFSINIATVLVAYYCFQNIFKYTLAAFTGTVLYVGSINRLSRLYDAAQMGAFSAMLFYPMVILALYSLLFTDVKERSYKKSWIYLVIGFSGLLQTHMISCLMVGIITIVMFLVYIKRVFRKETLLELGKAVLAGVLLNMWFLIPFLSYFPTYMRMEYVDFRNIEYGAYLAKFCNETHNFYNIFTNNGMGYSLAAVVFLYLLALPFLQKGKDNRMWIGFSLLTLTMSMYIFPYVTIAKINPLFITLFNTIQSAGRFMSVAVLFLSCLGCLLIKNITLKKEYIYILVFVICGFTLYQDMIYLNGKVADAVYTDIADLGINTTGNGEYIPIGTVVKKLSENIIYDQEVVEVSEWNREYLTVRMTANNTGTVEQTVAVPLLYYKGYQAYDVESGQNLQVIAGENNRVSLILPGQYEGNIEICFRSFWYWRAAEILSFITFLGLLGNAVIRQHMIQKGKYKNHVI